MYLPLLVAVITEICDQPYGCRNNSMLDTSWWARDAGLIRLSASIAHPCHSPAPNSDSTEMKGTNIPLRDRRGRQPVRPRNQKTPVSATLA
jgi:hypothetical protein